MYHVYNLCLPPLEKVQSAQRNKVVVRALFDAKDLDSFSSSSPMQPRHIPSLARYARDSESHSEHPSNCPPPHYNALLELVLPPQWLHPQPASSSHQPPSSSRSCVPLSVPSAPPAPTFATPAAAPTNRNPSPTASTNSTASSAPTCVPRSKPPATAPPPCLSPTPLPLATPQHQSHS